MRSFSSRFTRGAAVLVALAMFAAPVRAQTITSQQRAAANRLIDAALRDTVAYDRLSIMTDRFGPRLSGSRSLEQAIDWVLAQERADGLDNVRGEPVMVPHWVRGEESTVLVSPRSTVLHTIGLGGTVATPPRGVTAPVLVVNDFDDLTRHAAAARGKIVLFDHPFPPDKPGLDGYGEAVVYRAQAPAAGARAGAVAVMIRSISSFSIQNPHTGATRYDTTLQKLPAVALSIEDAEMLHRMQNHGEKIVVTLKTSGRTLPDAPSRNVVAELRGSEKPDEVVVLGGHIDSWDVGQGAMDDGACSVGAWEAVRLMKQLGLHPKRTVRAVMWVNEENGGRGGRAYRDAHAAELSRHSAALECDNGVFRPYGVRFQGSDAGLAFMKQVGALLDRIGASRVVMGESEADVGPIIQRGVPGLALDVDDTKYFWYHHSAGDMMTVIGKDDYDKCIATMAVLAYVLADLDQPVPR